MVSVTRLLLDFERHFGSARGALAFRAPGRVNLIGEHTDYNGGYVLPAAIDRDVAVVARANGSRRVAVLASDYGERREFLLGESATKSGGSWLDYFEGVAWALEERKLGPVGMDAVVAGDVPIASGLSSSAALEVAVALAFLGVAGRHLARTELAKLCRRAENEFVGVGCGIMDQFTALHGARGYALFLDCSTLEFRPVPLPSELATVVVCDTGVRRELAASGYNARRKECETALEMLKRTSPRLRTLSDLDESGFSKLQTEIPELLRRRVRHVVTENRRVKESVAALEAGDVRRFGELMGQSHESLRDDYEVSCPELDAMVETAGRVSGTFGARMTGAGFGGCTVNLVAPRAVDDFLSGVPEMYRRRTGVEAALYVCETADGAGRLAFPREDRNQ